MLSNEKWFGASAGFYPETIGQSLRLDGTSAHLSKTYSTTASSTTDFVMSLWFKAILSGTGDRMIASSYDGATVMMYWQFQSDRKLRIYIDPSSAGSNEFHVTTDMVFRDSTNWYNICLVLDMSQSSNVDKAKIYVNGTQASTTQTYSTGTPTTQNVIKSGTTFNISKYFTSAQYIDGYIAEVNIIDGSANYTDFGESKNGVWIPKAYTGSYGNNGARLTFADSSSLGDDTSGNGNDFTSSGLASTDVVLDSPTNNFCTLNRLNEYASVGYMSISEGNLKSTASGTPNQNRGWKSTHAMTSGKWYWEVYFNSSDSGNNGGVGVSGSSNPSAVVGETSDSTGFRYMDAGVLRQNGSNSSTITAIASGDIVMVALDIDGGKAWVGKNGTWFSSGNPSTDSNPITSTVPSEAFATSYHYTTSSVQTFNFGQDSSFAGAVSAGGNTDGNGVGDFKYSVPSGYLALCSSNLPDTTLSPNQSEQATDYFNTRLYVGDGQTTQAITGVGFQPDWLWIKERSSTSDHVLLDSSRGASKFLVSNSTQAESTATSVHQSFDPDGFTVGSSGATNQSSQTYVSWNWKVNGGTTSSNTDGTITSTVQASTEAGFSIVTYSANNSAGDTVGHGLGVAPDMVIIKKRNVAERWFVWHTGDSTEYMYLNESFVGQANLDDRFGNNTTVTLPSSTVLTLGTNNDVNGASGTYVAYCFAEIEGYSKFGSYVGNNSTDGTFVYTGFRPAWIMFKRADSADNWAIFDVIRDTINPLDSYIYADNFNTEATFSTAIVDALSNGFKWRGTVNFGNASGGTYIYMAFADQPFKFSNAR